MYGLKIPKSQQPDKLDYTLYYPHTKKINDRVWDQNYTQFISIDPALKNLALRIERRYKDGKIVCLFSAKYNPSNNCVTNNINNLYQNINNILDEQQHYFIDTHFVIIEKQIPKNHNAVRIAQHLVTYFLINFKNLPLCPSIIEVDPKLKGKMLGAPKNINERQLKLWSIEKAIELATKREDEYTLTLLKKTKKKDDLADVLCQIEAFCLYVKI